MRFGETFVAVDWGTTNRRAYRIEGGAIAASEADDRGVSALSADDYVDEIAGLRRRLGDWPMLLAGMVGSTIGWREARYVPAPAGLPEIAAALLRLDDRTAIVPGVSQTAPGRHDVMRGEEIQLLGAGAAGLVPADALLVQPGTHGKWVTMGGGRIERFTTAMTGELFGLLRHHSILRATLAAPVEPGRAFVEGVREGAGGDLAARLFGVRAATLLDGLDTREAASFVSGLLIGDEVANRLAEHADATVHIVADPALGDLYATAIEANGRATRRVASEVAFVAGMTHLTRFLR